MESFKDRDRESMQANREKLENLEWDVIKKLSDHLDEEQMNLYVDLLEKEQEAMKAQMQERRGGKGAGGEEVKATVSSTHEKPIKKMPEVNTPGIFFLHTNGACFTQVALYC